MDIPEGEGSTGGRGMLPGSAIGTMLHCGRGGVGVGGWGVKPETDGLACTRSREDGAKRGELHNKEEFGPNNRFNSKTGGLRGGCSAGARYSGLPWPVPEKKRRGAPGGARPFRLPHEMFVPSLCLSLSTSDSDSFHLPRALAALDQSSCPS